MKRIVLAAAAVLFLSGPAYAGHADHEVLNPEVAGATSVSSLPSTCYLLASDVDNAKPIYVDCDNVLDLKPDVVISDSSYTLTETTNSGVTNYIDASSNGVAIAFPDGSTNTEAGYDFVIEAAPTAANQITFTLNSGDLFEGSVLVYDSAGTLVYASSDLMAPSGTADKLVFNSTGIMAGDKISIGNVDNSVWNVAGNARFQSAGSNNGGQKGIAAVEKFQLQ